MITTSCLDKIYYSRKLPLKNQREIVINEESSSIKNLKKLKTCLKKCTKIKQKNLFSKKIRTDNKTTEKSGLKKLKVSINNTPAISNFLRISPQPSLIEEWNLSEDLQRIRNATIKVLKSSFDGLKLLFFGKQHTGDGLPLNIFHRHIIDRNRKSDNRFL